uniref:DUF6821 domain-containing protein n=1 Tax=Zea mays TaxID=4577 RepID=A0A804NHH3_MAIZE
MAARILMVRSFSLSHGGKNLDDKETVEHDLLPPSGDVDVHDECKGIGVVLDETCKSAVPSVADPIMNPEGGEEEKAIQSPDAEESVTADSKFAQEEEEEEDIKKDGDDKVGALIGALCSFGVAAATACVFLIGGRLHHQHTQQHKIQLQFFGDDKRIQQVVRQTSRLNQKAMSFAMGAGAKHRPSSRVRWCVVDIRLVPPQAHDVAEGEDVGKVPVDGSGSDSDDPWHVVDDGVVIGAGVAGGAYDEDTVDGGVEGAERDRLMIEGLGVVGERRVLAERDEDDVSIVMDGRLEVHEDGALAATHSADQ